MTHLTESRTPRGFARVDFLDRSGQACSLQKSSLATEEAIWLGVDGDRVGNQISARMHLTQEDVAGLLPYLHRFVETGQVLERHGGE